ncbi:T9SS type A sorting domain-containing protein [Aequorivita nionensis]|jgi:hypothetical protein|uniref:T9SS type A sorting domain-containing protein n=1 Tax=Aequorivita nionensis TaxID=1287690 RepID=UPI003965C597
MQHKLFIIFLIISYNTYSQFGPQKIITESANGTRVIFSADLDGDGDLDIMSANKFGSSLTWYRNLDGYGTFGPENLIAILDQTIWISAADLDGDGDMDVLAVSGPQNRVAWYENLDGQGNFSSLKSINGGADGASCVIAEDLDGDGDLDAISAADLSNTIAWYENTDGQGDFSNAKIIDNTIGSPRFVMSADMDGDGDLDVLGNGSSPLIAYWMENMDGQGTFGTRHVITDSGAYLNVVFAADVDNDGDMDVFSASPADKEVAWYENLDGLGNFGSKNSITSTLIDAWTVFVADLDNDGDNDVLATNADPFGGEVVWFENLDGLGSFSTKKIISTEVQSPRSVIAADIDNDGDMDVISSSQNDDKIAWYENLTIIGIEENQLDNIKIYPNPTTRLIFIESKTENILGATIFDILGKNVLQEIGNIQEMDISHLQSGMYFLRIKTDSGEFVQKIIKE